MLGEDGQPLKAGAGLAGIDPDAAAAEAEEARKRIDELNQRKANGELSQEELAELQKLEGARRRPLQRRCSEMVPAVDAARSDGVWLARVKRSGSRCWTTWLRTPKRVERGTRRRRRPPSTPPLTEAAPFDSSVRRCY